MKAYSYLACLLLFVLFLLTNCATQYQVLDPKKGFYKRDIGIYINGYEYEGVTVVPNASEYELVLKPKGNMDLILIKTCHRTFSAEKKDKGFLGIGGGQFTYNYIPTPPMETDRVCPLRVDVYESSKKGRQSWAFVDFENPSYQLNYKLICDGEISNVNGVGVCQALTKTWQRLEFTNQVRFSPPEPNYCSKPIHKGNNSYELAVTKDECLYHFDTNDGRLGRLTVIGYTGVLIREGQ